MLSCFERFSLCLLIAASSRVVDTVILAKGFPVELLGHCFPSLRSVCCPYPGFIQIVSTLAEIRTT